MVETKNQIAICKLRIRRKNKSKLRDVNSGFGEKFAKSELSLYITIYTFSENSEFISCESDNSVIFFEYKFRIAKKGRLVR